MGYLSKLETRLAATEVALYNALCEVQKLSGGQGLPALSPQNHVERMMKQSKNDKMRDWITFPLENRDGVHRWWVEKRSAFARPSSESDMAGRQDFGTDEPLSMSSHDQGQMYSSTTPNLSTARLESSTSAQDGSRGS